MKDLQGKPRTISIEGNIGAGKSTLLSIIEKKLDVQIMYEPHKKWQKVGSDNLLEKFYSDTKRWAYTFQTYAFVSRVVHQEMLYRQHTHVIYIIERSVFSDRYCFAKNCFEMGTMSPLEWQLYQEWFSWLVDGYTKPLDGFIYLKTDPEVCYQRLQKRARTEEQGVSLDYLKMIHERHEQWLVRHENLEKSISNVPVLILDCNREFENNVQEKNRIMDQISTFYGISTRKPEPAIEPTYIFDTNKEIQNKQL